MIGVSLFAWCLVAICYRRVRARQLRDEQQRRLEQANRADDELRARARLRRDNRRRQARVDRASRQISGSDVAGLYPPPPPDDMYAAISLSVNAIVRLPSYTAASPPPYSEIAQDEATAGSMEMGTSNPAGQFDDDSNTLSTGGDLPPSYSSIFTNEMRDGDEGTSNAHGHCMVETSVRVSDEGDAGDVEDRAFGHFTVGET